MKYAEELNELKKIFTELQNIPESNYRKLICNRDKENSLKTLSSTDFMTCEKSDNLEYKENSLKTLSNKNLVSYKKGENLEDKENSLNIQRDNEELMILQSKIDKLISENLKLKKKVEDQRNELINEKGLIRVICRIKPTSTVHNNLTYSEKIINFENKKFYFDKVFSTNAKQEEIFEEVKASVESIVDGYSVCIFAYGQTGSGKTYTMEGNSENRGIIYRALSTLKESLQEIDKNEFNISFHSKYVEIYNENIIDLIGGGKVEITHKNEEVVLNGCIEINFTDLDSIASIVQKASQKRSCGETKCNTKSSRSHSVFILDVKLYSSNETKEGSLILIDLAGSERLQASKAVNERLKEAQNINRSLSALGNVFNAIKRNDSHIPFRDSKLTHLMKNYLTGKSRTTMILNINTENINETLSSLRFGAGISECRLGNASKNIKKNI